ncbi:uncharacterized protein LOC105761753 [Gossypium raimondii]|uniref:uncharacterized protein LOC105761753 n=1 Tax=Gossypium raimondii TaxID=29730 RepID=UPI00063AD31E|nr:uncharacterized protein LOC105761753 [Gossypium raimondii]XP_012435116.1 uncharacterized protein LOC105761753 [Gossypium raimondii]XP_052480582.1 uncharacterized protein LOC105761753 [Gossypium raimondii]
MSENQDIPCPIGVVSDAESDPPENEPDDSQMHLSTRSKKRSREIEVEAKGKAPKKWTSGKEASTSQQQSKPKSEKNCGKAVQNRLKNINHQIDRRRKAYKMSDLEFLTWVNPKSFPVPSKIPASFKQIKKGWPMRPDLQSILQKIQDIKAKFKDHFKDHLLTEVTVTEELDTVEAKLNELGQKRSEEQTRDPDAVFSNNKDTNMGTGTLIKEFCSAYPWLFSLDQHPDQDHGSLSTLEGIQSLLKSFENQLYDENNNKVSVEDFEGLEEALKKPKSSGLLPDYLRPIANQIEQARGKATGIAHTYVQVFVCAAIKEMQDFAPVEMDMLKIWAAALNYARQHGFQVTFADHLLRKNFDAYIHNKFGLGWFGL